MNSYVLGVGGPWANGGPGGGNSDYIGAFGSTNAYPVVLHGSANLTLTGVNQLRPSRIGSGVPVTDFSGTYIVQAVNGSLMALPGTGRSNWTTGNFAIASGAIVQMGEGTSDDVSVTYAHTISGSGTWVIRNSQTLTLGSGGIVRPGSAGASDAATLTFGDSSSNTNITFASGSDVKMDIIDASTSDKLLFPAPYSAATVTIGSGAKLDIDLFTPSITTPITNMVLWDANYTGVTLSGSYSIGNITYNNSTGWTGLSIVETGNQILLNGTYTASAPPAVPEPATLLLVGTGVVGALGFIRRRRMS